MHVYACARFRPARAAGLAGVPDVASGLLGDGGGHPRAVRVPGLDSDGSSGAGEARDAGASIGASRAALRRAARVREQQGLRLAASKRFDPVVIDRHVFGEDLWQRLGGSVRSPPASRQHILRPTRPRGTEAAWCRG